MESKDWLWKISFNFVFPFNMPLGLDQFICLFFFVPLIKKRIGGASSGHCCHLVMFQYHFMEQHFYVQHMFRAFTHIKQCLAFIYSCVCWFRNARNFFDVYVHSIYCLIFFSFWLFVTLIKNKLTLRNKNHLRNKSV